MKNLVKNLIRLKKDKKMGKQLELTVVGLGNVLSADDGIGVKLVYALEGLSPVKTRKDIKTIDGGVGGLRLLNVLEESAAVLAIDAADIKREPGTAELILPKQVLGENIQFSLHDLGFAQTIKLLEKFFKRPACCIYAIQPAVIEQSETLSSTLIDSFDRLLEEIKILLENWTKYKNRIKERIRDKKIDPAERDKALYSCLKGILKVNSGKDPT